MHRGLLVATLLLIAPCAAAQVQYYGTLGIYDDPAHTQPFGSMLPGFKTLYIGLDLEEPLDASEWLEFSVSGLAGFSVLEMDIQPPPQSLMGDIHAPADTLMGSGGLFLAWQFCIPDSMVSIALTIASDSPPADHAFKVLRRFPSMSIPYPNGLYCDGPAFIRMPLVGLSYTLNPTIALESRTWSAVKNLYRGP